VSIPERIEELLRPHEGKNPENVREVKFSKGQVVRLLLKEKRSEQGYKSVVVSTEPSRTLQARCAAVVALRGVKMENARYAIILSESIRPRVEAGASLEELRQVMQEPRFKKASDRDFFDSFKLNYLYELMEYFRPDFNGLPERERIALLGRAVEYVNEFLESSGRLASFLKYGDPYENLPSKPVKKVEKQVQAAELRELMGPEPGTPLPYREVGRILGEELEPRQSLKSYDRRISRMVKSGTSILKQALGGEQGYRAYMGARRAELEYWRSLTQEEQQAMRLAENFGVSTEEAYRMLRVKGATETPSDFIRE
jgi:hypothetical protein